MLTLPTFLPKPLLGAAVGAVIAMFLYWGYITFTPPVQAFLGMDQGAHFSDADRLEKQQEVARKVQEILATNDRTVNRGQ